MSEQQKNSPVGIILIVLLLAALGIAGWWFMNDKRETHDAINAGIENTETSHATNAPVETTAAPSTNPEGQTTAIPQAAQSSAPAVSDGKAVEIDVAKAMGVRSMGNENAPVKLIEYASLTCSHCAHFHNEILPEMKTKYIDTGKVYIEFREFPLNDPALRGTLAARCLPAEKYDGFVSLLFKTQEHWAGGLDYMAALKQDAKLAGMSEETFDACQNNKELLGKIAESMQTAKEKWKIEATPTFIVNDGKETISGAVPLTEFERVFRLVTNNAVGDAPAVE